MFRLLIIFFFSCLIFTANASNKEKIIIGLKNTSNLSFRFEQNINGEIEIGNCTIEYPKKMYCLYEKNNKVLVSNGKSLVIKTLSSYYRYPLERTPLNLILDKNFLIDKIYNLDEKIIEQSYINYTINENENQIDIFFDLETFNLIGWQTKDIYQNTAITLLYSVLLNQEIKKQLFKLPTQN
jgi:outer membrane lipoprotein-sorting protein